MRAIVAPCIALATLVAAAVTVVRTGGARDARPDVPHATAADKNVHGGRPREAADAYQVATRFIDALDTARLDVPSLRASQALFSFHARKMPIPWVPLTGDAAHLAVTIALRSTLHSEGPPDAQTGGEGSFDQREAIFAPAPATIAFHTAIPIGARLTFSPATINVSTDAVVFDVVLLDAKSAEHVVYSRRVAPPEMRTWLDASIDLSAYAGQEVELRFKTSLSPATAAEHVLERKPTGHRAPRAQPAPGEASAPAPQAAPKETPAEKALASGGAIPLALWGNPTLLAKGAATLPYNVLWIVVDSLRADALASLHDDADEAALLNAPMPPLEALLPKMDGLAPSLDALATRSVRFSHAYSAATWIRPGVMAMLGGARASELGVDPFHVLLNGADNARFYASDPPLLPLLFRKNGAIVRAFVNDDAIVATLPNGVDVGFDRVDDRRDRTRDSAEISSRAGQWIKTYRDQRFFLLCHYASPREPLEPPAPALARVPQPPIGPRDETTRLYLGEVAKDDDAIGTLLSALDEAGLRDRTIVVVTADYGETLSSAHEAKSPIDRVPMRFHHASSQFEETTHVPILIALPGVLTPHTIKDRVRTIDLAPTLLDLEGLDVSARTKMSGRSLLPLARGDKEDDPRVVVSEGRGSRAILSGKYRLTVIDAQFGGGLALYDLEEDPGERHDLSREKPDIVAEMQARLDAAMKNVPVAGTKASLAPADAEHEPLLHFRFAGAGRARRIAGSISVGASSPSSAPSIRVIPVSVPNEALMVDGSRVTLAFTTAADGAVGFDLRVAPNAAPVHWELTLDDDPFPDRLVFAGPYGLASSLVRSGIGSDEARAAITAKTPPFIDPATDLGLFVTRDIPDAKPR